MRLSPAVLEAILESLEYSKDAIRQSQFPSYMSNCEHTRQQKLLKIDEAMDAMRAYKKALPHE